MLISSSNIFSFAISKDLHLSLEVAGLPLAVLVVIALAIFVGWKYFSKESFPDFQLEAAELGLGDHRFHFKPNILDRQIAYSIWVELSTRKIGLPIDLDHDVISEVYDSWYNFFSVTRELIKSVPVSKVNDDSTNKIISLSVEVLNEGLRPHLTQWQARFRRWNERHLRLSEDISPQDAQKAYPSYDELSRDLLQVNERLILYRMKMYELVTGKSVDG